MNNEKNITCQKISYNSYKDAQTHLNYINRAKRGRRKDSKVKPKRSYLCDLCDKWHLTSQHEFQSNKKRRRR